MAFKMKCESNFNNCQKEAKWKLTWSGVSLNYCDEHKEPYENDKDFIIKRVT